MAEKSEGVAEFTTTKENPLPIFHENSFKSFKEITHIQQTGNISLIYEQP